jgi:hypothetical protein
VVDDHDGYSCERMLFFGTLAASFFSSQKIIILRKHRSTFPPR